MDSPKGEEWFREEKQPKAGVQGWDAKMHSPGIEPGTSAWKADILPLNYEC